MYYNYRPYNPRDGRWVGRDSIGEILYCFCNNAPSYRVDINGNSVDDGDSFFGMEAAEIQIASYVDVSFNRSESFGETYVERITMRIVPRFSPPREITVYTIGGSGNNALGGANNKYTP